MARSVSWKRTASDAVSWRQDQALSSTIYILRETGPTGFLLKEEGETKKFKVLLGDPHKCTCPVFTKEKDLCKHICWVLLRKFRVPRQNPVTWQLGLVEREINEILRGVLARQEARPRPGARKYANIAAQMGRDPESDQAVLPQREIGEDDVCPICQEELLAKHLPVTYCKFGCGNNVHIKCMKVWAEHQKTSGKAIIECPFCREDFGPISLLQQEMRNSSQRETRAERMNEHLGTTCRKCHVCPIMGKCYKCSVCVDYHLCQACFNTPTHMEHGFQFRQKVSQRWRPAPSRSGTGGALPQAVVTNLMGRDLSEADYDLLLQLDDESGQQPSDLTQETIQSFPMERVRLAHPLLAPGQQCRVCLRSYDTGQFVRRLPCHHKFHRDCIDDWLLHRHPTCPVDGTVFTNESVQRMREANRARLRQLRENTELQQEPGRHGNRQVPHGFVNHRNQVVPNGNPILEIPGVGITRLGGSNSLPASATRALTNENHSTGQTEVTRQNIQLRPRSYRNDTRETNTVLDGGRLQPPVSRGPHREGVIGQYSPSDQEVSGLSLGEVIGMNIGGTHQPSDDILQEMIINIIANDNKQRRSSDVNTPDSGLSPAVNGLHGNGSGSGIGYTSSGSSASSSRRTSQYRSDPSINLHTSNTEDSILTIDDLGSQSSGHSNGPNRNILFDLNGKNGSRHLAKETMSREISSDRPQERLERALRRHGGTRKNGNLIGRLSQPGQGHIRENLTDFNVSGHSVGNNEDRNSHITIAAENRFNGQRVDSQSEVINQAPSIPQPRTNNNLALGVGFPAQNNEGVPPVTMAARKPPSGDANHRPGRHRSKPSTRETISRTNSTGRDRSRSRERSENKNTLGLGSLYIGHSPASVIGFNSEFLLSSNESRGSGVLRKGKSSSHDAKSNQSGARATIQAHTHISGDMTLSGSAVGVPNGENMP